MSQKAKPSGPRRGGKKQTHPDPDPAGLLCRAFGISDPERVDRFLGNGLFDSIWVDVEEVGEHYSPAEIRRIKAAQCLVRTLARVRLGSTRPGKAQALVPDLFVAHSDPHLDVVGALYYSNEGVPLGDRVVYRGQLTRPWISLHQVAAPALALKANQMVIFLLRPGGYAETGVVLRDFPDRAWRLLTRPRGERAALLRLVWVVTAAGPQQWQTPSGSGPILVRGAGPHPESAPLCHPEAEMEIRWALAILLGAEREARGGRRADDLLAGFGGIAGLALSQPEQLPAAGIPAPERDRVAAILELSRRLAVATVPRRPRATGSYQLHRYLTEKYRNEAGEVGLVVMLDRNHRVVGEYRLYHTADSPEERRIRASPARLLPQAMAARAAVLLPVTLSALIPGKGKRRELWVHEAHGRLHLDLDRPEDHPALDDQTWLAPGYGGAPGPPRRLRQYDLNDLRAFFPLDQGGRQGVNR